MGQPSEPNGKWRFVEFMIVALVMTLVGFAAIRWARMCRTCPPVVTRAPDAGQVPAVAVDAGTADARTDRVEAVDPVYHAGQRIHIPLQITSCYQSPKKKQCHMNKGGELVILDEPDDLDTRKGKYQPTKTDRDPWLPDPENAGLNECPAGIIAFSESALKNGLAAAELDALEDAKLRRIFAK